MSQEIVCWNRQGVVMASDSLVVLETDAGRQVYTRRKLYPLGTHAALVSAGLAVGIELCQSVQRRVQALRLYDMARIYDLAVETLSAGYSRFRSQNLAWFETHSGAHRRLCFCLAGYDIQDADNPSRVYLLQSEGLQLPFQRLPLAGPAITIPRQLMVEAALVQKMRGGASLESLARACRSYLERLAERLPDEIGGPFLVATITEDGVSLTER